MKRKIDFLGLILASVTGLALFAAIIVRAFMPRMILPSLDIIAVVALSLVALVIDYYIERHTHRNLINFILVPIYGAFVFGIFPYAAAFTAPIDSLKLAFIGAIAFTVLTYLFDTMTDRLSSSPATKIAPLISAFGLFLATQCLMNII